MVLIASLTLACAGAAPQQSYDCGWWLGLPVNEREAFLNGYVDCYRAEVDASAFRSSTLEYERALSARLKSTPGLVGRPIHEIIQQIAPGVPEPRPRGGAERYDDKHGYFNLDYWASALKNTRERTRFIEGYLVCQREDRGSTVRYSKSAEWYAQEVTAELKRVSDWNQPIGEILFQFRDK